MPMRLCIVWELMAIALCFAIPAFAESKPGDANLLTGTAAYGDWSKDAPGVRRLITVADMPPPGATPAASNFATIVKRPNRAWPEAPAHFKVSVFMAGFNKPRQMRVAPNGDIFLAESGARDIRVLRSDAGAEKAGSSSVFAGGLDAQPYGISFYPSGSAPEYVYIATETQILRYPYRSGDLTARGRAEIIVPNLPQGHHWTRDIAFTPDSATMLVSVGSYSNDAENGMRLEKNRADILAFSPDGTNLRVFASGLRNPVTLSFHPETGDLWVTVNERDGLGDNLPPDYATRVRLGEFYGWPWYYVGAHLDPNHRGQTPELRSKIAMPDVLFQPHSAPLGFAVYEGSQFPLEYHGDLFIAFHGSWNRANRTGYKLVRVRLDHGKPTGEYDDFLTGFVTRDGDVWGRPVGVAVASDGALLVSDDASGTVWRIAYTGENAR